jgi:hypothetical protein
LDPACFRLFANPTFKACVLFVNLWNDTFTDA